MAPKTKMGKRKAGTKSKGKKKGAVATLTTPLRRAIKAIVRGEGETKRTAFYQCYNNGSSSARCDGLYRDRGWSLQNNLITTNNTDIHQVIPFVLQGTDDYNRIGQRIRPVSLTVQGSVRCDLSGQIQKLNPADLKVYIYILEHVSLKDYGNLYSQNDFNQLFEDAEGGTVPFTGIPQNPAMNIAKQYYKLLQKKQITLRYGGAYMNPNAGTGLPPVDSTACVANSHTWYADFGFNLTKHLPKVLKYPEDGNSPAPPASVLNSPTNSAIFMSFGFVDWFNPSDSTSSTALPRLEQTYVANMSYKDM